MQVRLCSKSFKLGFSSLGTKNSAVQAGFWRDREQEVRLPTLTESWRKQGSFRNISTSASWATRKSLTEWITTNCGKLLLKRWEYQTTLPVFWETYMWVKKQQLESYMEQWTGSKLWKEYKKTVYCYPAYLISMQNKSCKVQGWMNHKPESRLLGQISTTSHMQKILLSWQSEE